MGLAEKADAAEEAKGMDISAELERREDRLKALEEAKAKLAHVCHLWLQVFEKKGSGF
jgi:hypothetical protein